MRKLFSTRVSDNSLSFALFILRVGFGGLMAVNSGWMKLTHFNSTLANWKNSMIGLSPSIELSMLIFAEFFCAVFVVLGLFTRLATIPLIIAMSVAFIKAHHLNYSGGPGGGQTALLFLLGFITLLFAGPGKASLDRFIGK